MAMQETGHETRAPTTEREGRDGIRAELYQIVEELMNARADRAKALRVRFDQLWADLGSHGDPTLH